MTTPGTAGGSSTGRPVGTLSCAHLDTRLVARLHVDLQRVISAACPA